MGPGFESQRDHKRKLKIKSFLILKGFLFFAPMVELVDTQDLKSCDGNVVRVQVPFGVQKLKRINRFAFFALRCIQFTLYQVLIEIISMLVSLQILKKDS
jgi:hypothetical protein